MSACEPISVGWGWGAFTIEVVKAVATMVITTRVPPADLLATMRRIETAEKY